MRVPTPFRFPARLGLVQLLALVLLHSARAGSATWLFNTPTTNWNDPINWAPQTVPNSPSDIATFAASNSDDATIQSDIELNTLFFSENAFANFVITVGDPSGGAVGSLTISGAGIDENANSSATFYIIQAEPTLTTNQTANVIRMTNNATITQHVYLGSAVGLHALGGTSAGFVGGQIEFFGNASASQPGGFEFVVANAGENGGFGGIVTFYDNSSAGTGPTGLQSDSGGLGSSPGAVIFTGTSTAGNASVSTQSAGFPGVAGGVTYFLESSTAGNAGLFGGPGVVPGGGGSGFVFADNATAGNAYMSGGAHGFFGNPGFYQFMGDSSGGTAQLILHSNVNLEIQYHNPPGIAIGSLDGEGTVFLGANNLTIGSNNLSTEFTGVIQDSGSVTKIGSGVLTFRTPNIYTGGTTVSDGVLRVTNRAGSGTGTGPVNVSGGSLGGTGTVAGAVTIAEGGVLSQNAGTTGMHLTNHKFTIQGPLVFASGSIYSYRLVLGQTVIADEVSANGAGIGPKAHFVIAAKFHQRLSRGTVFTALDNTSANPIAGTFINLPDGAIVKVNGNNLQASYEGGDGNDLTLTVVP